MPVALYMDVHIPRAITQGLRLRTVDVLTAQEDGAEVLSDSDLLNRASELHRVLVTFDADLLVEAARRQREMLRFSGVIYLHASAASIGKCVHDLELIAKIAQPEDIENRVIFLPW